MLVLVRHGQTAVNVGGLLQGRSDAPLTDLGRQQAEAAARAVGDAALVVSSPLARAMDTAACFGAPVTVDERWVELDYGEFDGLAFAEVPAATWAHWRTDPSWAPPGGESLVACGARVGAACGELAERAISETVVVVSHVSPIKAAIAWALGAGESTAWRMFLDVAAICRIRTGAPGVALVAFNDVAHLAALRSG